MIDIGARIAELVRVVRAQTDEVWGQRLFDDGVAELERDLARERREQREGVDDGR